MTADSAYYEVGNFLRKNKRIDLVKDFLNVLKFIKVERVNLSEDVLKIAIDENLTYYDAVYLFLSRKYNIPLVSDDKDLVNKGTVKSSQIKY
nr:type II toxin-antitoxin system VapC family toxin [Acidianus sp. HS-5]